MVSVFNVFSICKQLFQALLLVSGVAAIVMLLLIEVLAIRCLLRWLELHKEQ